MIKKKLLLLSVALWVSACSRGNEVPVDKMVQVCMRMSKDNLTELYADPTALKLTEKQLGKYLEAEKISEEDFEKTVELYQNSAEKLDAYKKAYMERAVNDERFKERILKEEAKQFLQTRGLKNFNRDSVMNTLKDPAVMKTKVLDRND